ncbi:MAG TPA: hypothetical protein PLK90_01360 [Clostridiales bacterium]|nr:hypothetical protein [Clostridiales bacterium]HQP69025.1 hypothetical protein [Clostridiales bacterium]
MDKTVKDFNKNDIILLIVSAVLLLISIYLVSTKLERTVVSGTKNEKGRVEIKITDYALISIPKTTLTYAPITNVRYYTDTTSVKSLISYVILYTTKEEFRMNGKRADFPDEEKRNFYNNLEFFLDDPEQKEFSKSFSRIGIAGISGLVLLIISLFLLIPRFKLIVPLIKKSAKNIDFSKLIKKSEKAVKQKIEKKGEKPTASTVYEMEPTVSKTLRFLLPGYMPEFNTDINIYRLPETDRIGIVCTAGQKTQLEQKFGSGCEYVICTGIKYPSEMIGIAQSWMKDFSGYLIIQTENIPELKNTDVSRLFKEHREKDSACTILSRPVFEAKIRSGKVIRSVANKILKVSEFEEPGDTSTGSEVFGGLICFNTKNLFITYSKLTAADPSANVPITRLIEIFYKNNNRVNSYMSGVTSKSAALTSQPAGVDIIQERSLSAIILAVENSSTERVENILGLLDGLKIKDKIVIVTSEDQLSGFEKAFCQKAAVIASENGLGDGYDVLKAEPVLKGLHNSILVIPEETSGISSEDLQRIISEHEGRNNGCTFMKTADKNAVFCVSPDLFFYASKRIIRDDETKKYYLVQITEILTNDKKRVQEIKAE